MQENQFRNEMVIDFGEEKILLRPTFENVAAMESDLGGVAYLAFKYGQGIDINTKKVDPIASAKSLPPISEAAKIIYYNQAEKKFTLEQIFQMCLDVGLKCSAQAVMFLVRVTAGNKFAKPVSERQKKSSSKKNLVGQE